MTGCSYAFYNLYRMTLPAAILWLPLTIHYVSIKVTVIHKLHVSCAEGVTHYTHFHNVTHRRMAAIWFIWVFGFRQSNFQRFELVNFWSTMAAKNPDVLDCVGRVIMKMGVTNHPTRLTMVETSLTRKSWWKESKKSKQNGKKVFKNNPIRTKFVFVSNSLILKMRFLFSLSFQVRY